MSTVIFAYVNARRSLPITHRESVFRRQAVYAKSIVEIASREVGEGVKINYGG